MTGRWRAVTAVVGLVVVAVVGVALNRTMGSPTQVATLEVQPIRYVRKITTEGQLAAVRDTPLTATVNRTGRYQVAWLIPEGTRVAAGDVVARFDPAEFERELADGMAEERIARARLAKAEAERQGTLLNLARDAELSDRELEVATRFQATDVSLYSKTEIIEAAIDAELARQRSQHATRNKVIRDQHSRADLELLDIERRKAELRVDQATEGLRGLEVVAPHAGIVIYDRDWAGNTIQVGEFVWSGRVLGRLPDLSEMQAEVFVLEADAGGLSEGLQATVVVEAHPETSYRATVKSVDPVAQQRHQSPVQYFRTILTLGRTEVGTMKPGQTVRAEITLAEFDQAIAIPRQAVAVKDGKTVVYLHDGGEFRPVEVTVGATGLGRSVITSGLSAGDVIALRNPTVDAVSSRPASSRPESRGPMDGLQ